MAETLEERTQVLGRRIFEIALREKSRTLKKKNWEAQVMDWCMKDPQLKTKVLRFVDVLPSLKTNRDVVTHMKEYFPSEIHRMPLALRLGRALVTPSLLTRGAAAHAIRWAVRRIAQHLIAAETLEETSQVLTDLEDRGAAFTIDLLGEAVKSEMEAEQYTERVIEIIRFLAKSFAGRGKHAIGIGPRVNVSVKPSALYSRFDPLDTEGSTHTVKKRLARILREAQIVGAFINLDMEQYEHRDLTLRIFRETLSDKEFAGFADVGIALQAYHRDSERVLIDLLEWTKKRRVPLTVRLIKGAYWDYEIIRARQNSWSEPVFLNKHETDIAFEKLTELLLQNHKRVRIAIGSHNIRSIAYAISLVEKLDLPKDTIEYQLLYGMADPIQAALNQLHLPVRIYVPFGPLIPGMGYLVRRILENTSNESFLRQGFLEGKVSPDVLLEDPKRLAIRNPKPLIILDETSSAVEGLTHFRNEPTTDFTHEEERRRMREAIQAMRHTLGKEIPLKIGGDEIKPDRFLTSTNPSDPNEVIAKVRCAGSPEAGVAIRAAIESQPKWGMRPVRERADVLFKTAEGMRRKRFELAALEILEVGKGWREADADVSEAIDYLEYYGREAIRIQKSARTQQVPGETNRLLKRPLGAGAVITPWNFPLAILTGMTSAALVTGNSVIMKPAEESPAVAHILMQLFEQAGIPDGVLNYLPGTGEGAGEALVKSPNIKFIAFTGSRDVGLSIRSHASRLQNGEHSIKRIVTEMGGKNAIIIDSDADLDEAIHGVMHSAFEFQGQKCSACSRLIILSGIYDQFLNRLVEAAKSLRVGRPEKPSTNIGPLISQAALDKAEKYVLIGKARHKVAYEFPKEALPQEGYFLGPTIFTDVTPDSPLAQEEIFAPILSCMRAYNFDEALKLANSTSYALTGGVYSRNPANIEKASLAFEAGNIYINRSITGAVVDRQPFGGFKLSGTGTKAGGPGYLEQFLFAQTISENTLRHGFAPL